MITVFVGYDPREAVGYSVFCHSVLTRTRAKVCFVPVRGGERRDGSNDFIYARFLTAWVMGFKGRAIWADGDMLCRGDIEELPDLLPPNRDVAVVKHDYKTKHPRKYLGAPNADYPRKNWSSLMVLDCATYPWRKFTPDFVRQASGAELHRFSFFDDDRIAELPAKWNHLVGEFEPNPAAKIAHFTIGLPCWAPYDSWEFADEWRAEREAMLDFQRVAA